jgi:DNA topoisomerase-2
MFMESDERLLKYQYDDGQRIEPEYYLPILPLALVNGCEGIGTGWSTNIPNYNPRDVAANIKRLINEEETLEMTPWYRGFKGEIEKKQSGRSGTRGDSFETYGIIEQTDNHTLEITELPIRFWTQDYKEFLESLVKPGEKGGEPQLQEYKEYHTDTSVHFVLSLSDEQMRAALNEGLYKRFRLTTKLSTSNMHLFNEDGTITRYTTPSEVLHSFFDVRMRAYTRRREILIEHAKQNLKRATNKVCAAMMLHSPVDPSRSSSAI